MAADHLNEILSMHNPYHYGFPMVGLNHLVISKNR